MSEKIKITKDLSYIHNAENIKNGDVFEVQKCPDEFKKQYNNSMWILNNDIYIRVLEHEYEKII